MLFFNCILFAVLLASGAQDVSAGPTLKLNTAEVSPPASRVLKRMVVQKVTITVVLQMEQEIDQVQTTNTTGSNPTDTVNNLLQRRTVDPLNPGGHVVDLTPADPTRQMCYPGGFDVPAPEDCEVVIAAQLYNSTGSLVAYPGTMVYVSYKSCAVVLQNLDQKAPEVQYNWAMLGKAAKTIFNSCFAGKGWNMGGALVFESYLRSNFQGLYITLQKFDDSHLEAPAPATNKPKPLGAM